MNEAVLPSVKTPAAPAAPGVYADIGTLVRLRFGTGGFSFLPNQPVGSILAGRHASRLRGRGLNFEEIRQYFPGDDIRQMDWKVTARTRQPHIRVCTEERGREVLLIVDQRLSMFFGSKRNFKSVTAAEIAALVAWRIIKAKDRIAAIVFGDQNFDVVPPGGSSSHVMRLLQCVCDHNQALGIDRGIVSGPEMLDTALERAERLVHHDALVILVTDGIGTGENTRRILSRIAAHNDVISVLVHDPLEAELPNAGLRVFASGELQLEADTSKRSLRDAFNGKFQERVERAKRFLVQREIPLMQVSTDQDTAQQVRRLLGQRIRK
ncbi:MAG: DUF58 domain-containing protein [Luteolibacter sp.]